VWLALYDLGCYDIRVHDDHIDVERRRYDDARELDGEWRLPLFDDEIPEFPRIVAIAVRHIQLHARRRNRLWCKE